MPEPAPPLAPVAGFERKARAQRSRAHAAVLRGLGLAILSGEFAEGVPLPSKETLMRRFGVSNTPLREALQSLTAKGLIAARTRVGTWVREELHWNMFDPDILAWRLELGIDDAFLAKLFEMRQSLEPVSAAVAAVRRTATEVADLGALVDQMAAARRDRVRFTEADVAFHLLVLSASGNPFMRSIGALIRTALAASFSSSAPTEDDERAERAIVQHRAIVDAIGNREPQAAADAMLRVIQQGWANNGGAYGRPLAAVTVADFTPAGDRDRDGASF